ncbi:MAG: CoB--CoM heterodisulfide reductase iron-sulfur subunit B family protein [Deltaproteobacteria bacterium]|nr:MAG: CoB--CoM heterodisulfide reductase iron-sulfur subunit B family protein [Deltaproteobacteria bacterium]
MKFVMLRCCTTPIVLQQYEWSTNAVLERLDIELVDVEELGCCGYPLRNVNFRAYVLSSARNLALSESRNLDLLTVCNCCYGTMRHVEHLLKADGSIRKEINTTLEKEGLKYEGDIQPKHILQVLYDDVGIETIREKIVQPFNGLRIATHYGCRILRPSKIVQFDKPNSPSKFDELVEVTGAKSVDWLKKHECCGSPLWGVNEELSLDLTENKLKHARKSGADFLCVACSYCQIQFDHVQKILVSRRGPEHQLPSILYPQLLGLSLGIDSEILGLHMNQISINDIEYYLLDKAASQS